MDKGWQIIDLQTCTIGFTSLYATIAELHKARDEENKMNSLKISFEKLLQNERTLKIQVCV